MFFSRLLVSESISNHYTLIGQMNSA